MVAPTRVNTEIHHEQVNPEPAPAEPAGEGAQDAGEPEGELPEGAADTHVPWVFVDDLDAHLARAQAGGAEIVEDISSHGYRAYAARDLEGHRWTFAQAPPSVR